MLSAASLRADDPGLSGTHTPATTLPEKAIFLPSSGKSDINVGFSVATLLMIAFLHRRPLTLDFIQNSLNFNNYYVKRITETVIKYNKNKVSGQTLIHVLRN